MGVSINATLIVGRSIQDLDITKAPYYAEFLEEDFEYHGWQTLAYEFYPLKEKDDPKLRQLDASPIYYDDDDLGNYFFGYVLVDSGSWDYAVINPRDLERDIALYSDRFENLFGAKPKVILYPRYG